MKEASLIKYQNAVVYREHNRRVTIQETEDGNVMVMVHSILPDVPRKTGVYGNVFCRGHFRESVAVYSTEGLASLSLTLVEYWKNKVDNHKPTEQ